MKHTELVVESFNGNKIRQTDELKQHDLQTRDHVYWKKHLIKDSLRRRWKGSYQVLLTNLCADKLKGVDSWMHVSHLKRASADHLKDFKTAPCRRQD